MSINITEKYIDLTKKQINAYMRLVFGNKFVKEYNDEFTEKYINIRYYNFYDNFENYTVRKKLINILRKTAEDITMDNWKDRELIEQMCTFLYYIFYFDNVVYYKDLKEKVKKVGKLRKRILGKEEEKFTQELYEKMKEYISQKEELLARFDTKEFEIKVTPYKDKTSIYRVNLKYDIPIPKVYSEYAKNKAFNMGLVNEDKLTVEYYLTTIKILKDIIKLNFKRQYVVEFTETILKKPQKLKGLLKIINNGAIQDKISLKIRYEKFLKNKEEFYELMREGYKIVIILDHAFECNYKNIESLDMFKYIIIDKDMEYYKEFMKSINKKMKNKIIEL